ncbi:MAG: DUF3419 family protein [Pseudomonadota bacterium]
MTEPFSRNRAEHLNKAVHRSRATSADGMLERMFTFFFKGLVYPQIWEDPDVDMQALALGPGDRVIAIASGGCNIMSYLTADPKQIIAVDLNQAHVSLTRLKLAAVTHLPNYDIFYRFFGEADEKANVTAYRRFLRDIIDADTRSYWEGRDWVGRQRISLFSRDLYHHGLLGYFIGAGHLAAKVYGINLKELTQKTTLEDQRSYFDTMIAPLFDKRLVRWATSKKLSLYGLGIPPAQYEALAGASPDGQMATVLRERLERLACDFPMTDNYFAWQAFNRGYPKGESGPLPPYLKRKHFSQIRQRADRVSVYNRSFTDHLADEPDESMNGYVLLDAQDWMTDAQLNALWSQITRTAAPGARVIFRTAGVPTILPGRVSDEIMDQWDYDEETSREAVAQDRSSIYGGFHLYRRKAA